MTIHVICVIKDAKADVYGTPMVFASKGVAIRSFQNEVNNGDKNNSLVAKHPEDFSLYQIGTYDDAYAVFESVNEAGRPELLMSGSNAVVMK